MYGESGCHNHQGADDYVVACCDNFQLKPGPIFLNSTHLQHTTAGGGPPLVFDDLGFADTEEGKNTQDPTHKRCPFVLHG